MIVTIDFKEKTIQYDEDISLSDLSYCLLDYVPEDTWGDFKIMINARIDENPDTDW